MWEFIDVQGQSFRYHSIYFLVIKYLTYEQCFPYEFLTISNSDILTESVSNVQIDIYLKKHTVSPLT